MNSKNTNEMGKKFKFIKVSLRNVKVNMNTCFISDIIEIKGKAKVFINGEWWQTELTKKQIVDLHNATQRTSV